VFYPINRKIAGAGLADWQTGRLAGAPVGGMMNIRKDMKKESVIDLEEAVEKVCGRISGISDTEVCSLENICGRILAEDVCAKYDQPPFPRSPFDGYAVRSADTKGASREDPVSLTVITEVDAGGWFGGEVRQGEAVRIMTGAPIPVGADAVIMQEKTDYGEDVVYIYTEIGAYQNYVFAGEDYRSGDVLLEKGAYIGPAETGIIASTGLREVRVYRRPRVAVISTGDELARPGVELTNGRIYDSNMYTIRAQLTEWGADVIACTHVGDDPEEAAGLIEKWAQEADLIVTSGGVSVGKKDIMHDVFEILSVERIFWRVGIKPGSAILTGKLGDTVILALSGNPYAAYVDMHMLVRPALRKLTGNDRLEAVRGKAELVEAYGKKSPSRRFVRAICKDGRASIEGHTGGNGNVMSGKKINVLIDIPAGSPALEAGSIVDVIYL